MCVHCRRLRLPQSFTDESFAVRESRKRRDGIPPRRCNKSAYRVTLNHTRPPLSRETPYRKGTRETRRASGMRVGRCLKGSVPSVMRRENSSSIDATTRRVLDL